MKAILCKNENFENALFIEAEQDQIHELAELTARRELVDVSIYEVSLVGVYKVPVKFEPAPVHEEDVRKAHEADKKQRCNCCGEVR